MSSVISHQGCIEDKIEILLETLPWVEKISGSVVVFKYGGNAMVSEELRENFALNMVVLRALGVRPVVVHGGGPHISSMLDQMGIVSEFKGGFRVTSTEAMRVIRMVLTGQVQREVVSLINSHGPYAIGLSGEDAGLLKAKRRSATIGGSDVDLGHVGEVVEVDPAVLWHLISQGHIPVISSIAPEVNDSHEFTGEILNINADTAAAAVAIALKAKEFVALSDVEGLYADWPNPESLIKHISVGQLKNLLPSLHSGMIPKMEAMVAAVEAGVPFASIIDGRQKNSVLYKILSSNEMGTAVHPD